MHAIYRIVIFFDVQKVMFSFKNLRFVFETDRQKSLNALKLSNWAKQITTYYSNFMHNNYSSFYKLADFFSYQEH